MEIAFDQSAAPCGRLQAVFGLMDRGGLIVPRGVTSVAVQVNVERVSGLADATAAIRQIENLRRARLGLGIC
jgi:hypothetical protein